MYVFQHQPLPSTELSSSPPAARLSEIEVTHITLSAGRREEIRRKLENAICIQLHNSTANSVVSHRLVS